MKENIQSILNKTQEDKFWFIMNLPEALKDLSKKYNAINHEAGINKNSIKFSLISANVPEFNVKAEAIKYGGGSMHISSHTKTPYNTLNITFKIDNKYTNYSTIYEWLNFIYSESEGHYDSEDLTTLRKNANPEIIGKYTTNISVVSLDEYAKPVIQWIFTYAFPTNVSNIDLKYTDSNEITCTATFVFAQMHSRNVYLENFNSDNDI